MRFISKNSNLRIILRPGLPANPLSGQLAVPTIYVKFLNGVAEVKDQDMVEKMLAHPGYNSDYISVEDNIVDPFLNTRQEVEPPHSITAIEYGHAKKVASSPTKVRLSPELEKAINERAVEIAKALLPKMMEDVMNASKHGSMREEAMETAEEENGEAAEVADIPEIKDKPAKKANKSKKTPQPAEQEKEA